MRRAAWVAALLLATLLVLCALIWSAASSTTGAQAVLALARWATAGALEVTQPSGALLGEFRAKQVQWQSRGTLVKIQGLQWKLSATSRLHFSELMADSVEIELPASDSPSPAPQDLRLPVAVLINQLKIGKLSYRSGSNVTVVSDIKGSATLNDKQHTWQLAAIYDQLNIASRGTLNAAKPFTCEASAALKPKDPASMPIDWSATLNARGPLLALAVSADVIAKDQSLNAQAVVTLWERTPLSTVKVQLNKFDIQPFSSAAPHTALTGTANVSVGTSAPLQIDAQLSNSLPGPWDQGKLPILAFNAQVSGDSKSGTLQSLQAELPGNAKLAATGTWQPSGKGDAAWAVALQLSNVRPSLLHTAVVPMQVSGKLDLKSSSLKPSRAAPIVMKADVRGRLDNTKLKQRDVALRIDSDVSADHLAVRMLQATSGDAQLELQGQADNLRDNSSFDVKAALTKFEPSAWLQWPHRALLNAKIEAKGAWPSRERWPAQLQTKVQLQDSSIEALPLRGQFNIDIAPLSQAALTSSLPRRITTEGALEIAEQKLQWSGRAGAEGDRLQTDIQAPAIQRIAPLIALIDTQAPRLMGSVDGRVTLISARSGPSLEWNGKGKQLQLNDIAINSARTNGKAGLHSNDTIELSTQLDGLQTSTLKLSKTELNINGTWASHDIRLLTQGTALQRNVQLMAQTHGLLTGEPMNPTRWESQRASAALTEDSFTWARSEVLKVAIDRPLNPNPSFDIEASLQELAAAPLLRRATGAPVTGDGWIGDLMLAANIKLSRHEQITADFQLTRKQGDLGFAEAGRNEMLGVQAIDLQVRGQAGRWSLAHRIGGERIGAINAQAEWTLPVMQWMPQPNTALSGTLEARVSNMDVWSASLPPGWRLGGQLEGTVRIAGSFGSPRGEGTLSAQRLSVRNLLQGVDMNDGQARLVLQGNELRLEQFSIKAGEGQLQATGKADLQKPPFRADLQLTMEKMRVLSRVDRRIVASGTATAMITARELRLDSKLRIDEGLIDISRSDAPELGDDVVVKRKATAEAQSAAQQKARPVALNVNVDLGDALRLRGHGLDTRLAGSLRITTPQGKLATSGTISAVDGTYAAYGQRLNIERGTLSFNGPINAPRLDVLATRRGIDNDQQSVGVSVTGTALNPRVRLYAEPDMTEIEKLAFLVSGRGYDALGRNDAALVQRAAFALLQGEGEGVSGITKSLGLDAFSVEQRANGDVKDTVVSVGKQISQRVYVGYERGLNATSGVFQLIYRLTQRLTLRAKSGDEAGVDLIWQWSWN